MQNAFPQLAARYNATMSDVVNDMADRGGARLDAVDADRFTLSIDAAIARYKQSGIPRTRRTIQRYCANGSLEAHRVAIPYGEMYLINAESLERHIAYILQGRAALADHGEPQRAASTVALPDPVEHENSTDPEDRRDIVLSLKDEITFLKEQINVKDAQLAVKDRQIADQSERARETNLLVASLHKLISPLIGQSGARPDGAASHGPPPLA